MYKLLVAFCHEAVATKYRLATFLNGTWLEWHLTVSTTFCTNSVVHFTFTHTLILSSGAAFFAALWGTEVFGVVELLFTLGEYKCGTAVAASDLLIGHNIRRKKMMYSFLLSVSRDRYFRTKDAVRCRVLGNCFHANIIL